MNIIFYLKKKKKVLMIDILKEIEIELKVFIINLDLN